MALRLFIIPALALLPFFLFSSVSGQGQITSLPCTSSMITSFTPCMSFISNSSFNGSSPTQDCCNSLKSLIGSGAGCLCQILTGSFPFQIPINRSLSVSLPRACNSTGFPFQCNVQAAAPAAGPVANGLSLPPIAVNPPPAVEESPTPAPSADATATPPSGTINGGVPTGISGSRVGTSDAAPNHSLWPLHIVALLGALALKFY